MKLTLTIARLKCLWIVRLWISMWIVVVGMKITWLMKRN